MSTKKVRQTATATATFVTSDLAATQAIIRAIGSRDNWDVSIAKTATKHNEFVIFDAAISYTAVGANRDDINKKFVQNVPAETVLLETRATIEKLEA